MNSVVVKHMVQLVPGLVLILGWKNINCYG